MQFVEMTYAYHCCAFEFPEKQKGYDSNLHRHYEEFKEKISDECTLPPTESEVISNKKKHDRSNISVSSHFGRMKRILSDHKDQWWIRNFPEVGAPTYNMRKFPKNCMKLKEFGSGGVRPKFYYEDPPLKIVIISRLRSIMFHVICEILSSIH